MRFTTLAVILGLATFELATAIPSSYALPYTKSLRKVYLSRVPCEQQMTPCNHQTRSYVVPAVTNTKVPLLRQVFTTITRKHDNLNAAHAESGKGINVKYQTGPSLEVEGEASASGYAKQRGAEHAEDSSSYPYVVMQPAQNDQYATPVEEVQCVDNCADQTEQYSQPMECVNDCA